MRCTEPVTSSSGNPTGRRRSDCHSESHQPRALRTRCVDDSTRLGANRQPPARTNSALFARIIERGRLYSAWHCKGDNSAPIDPQARSTQKCTEPVASSSGFPTDRRRSDCRSENHQPQTLRTRCKQHPMGPPGRRQGRPERTSRNLRSFLFAQVELRSFVLALVAREVKKGPGPQGPAAKFAEPGTLSSTFPTNLPLPRTAPRGASIYRRPVLGAAGLYADPPTAIKGLAE
jgi:hypothetical protein